MISQPYIMSISKKKYRRELCWMMLYILWRMMKKKVETVENRNYLLFPSDFHKYNFNI